MYIFSFFSVLQGITGGTFLYVTFFEVLPHELNQRGNRIMKLIFVLVGFLFMCGLMFITHQTLTEVQTEKKLDYRNHYHLSLKILFNFHTLKSCTTYIIHPINKIFCRQKNSAFQLLFFYFFVPKKFIIVILKNLFS